MNIKEIKHHLSQHLPEFPKFEPLIEGQVLLDLSVALIHFIVGFLLIKCLQFRNLFAILFPLPEEVFQVVFVPMIEDLRVFADLILGNSGNIQVTGS